MGEKSNVKKFKKKYKLKKIDSDSLIAIIEKQGYTVIHFSNVNNDEKVCFLIEALQVKKYVQSCKCFTYQDDKYRLLFINKDLTEDERRIVLSHEEGHIWYKHMVSNSVFGSDVYQEYQANEFAHYLLLDSNENKRMRWIIAVSVMAVVLALNWEIKKKNDAQIYTDNYFRTESGTKYHIKGCIYLRNKTGIKKVTKEEFYSGEYEPCAVCIPFDD